MRMFCINCGKQISDTTCFCPFCGAERTENIHGNQVSDLSKYVEKEEDVPVYKRKNKAAPLVGFLPLIYAICCLFVALTW